MSLLFVCFSGDFFLSEVHTVRNVGIRSLNPEIIKLKINNKQNMIVKIIFKIFSPQTNRFTSKKSVILKKKKPF